MIMDEASMTIDGASLVMDDTSMILGGTSLVVDDASMTIDGAICVCPDSDGANGALSRNHREMLWPGDAWLFGPFPSGC